MDYKNTKLLLMVDRIKSGPTGYDYPFTSIFITDLGHVDFSHSEIPEAIKLFEKSGNEFSANKLRTEYQAIINL